MGNTTYFAWVAFDLEIYTSEKANSGETNEKKKMEWGFYIVRSPFLLQLRGRLHHATQ